jgi:hypothetical protein
MMLRLASPGRPPDDTQKLALSIRGRVVDVVNDTEEAEE